MKKILVLLAFTALSMIACKKKAMEKNFICVIGAPSGYPNVTGPWINYECFDKRGMTGAEINQRVVATGNPYASGKDAEDCSECTAIAASM